MSDATPIDLIPRRDDGPHGDDHVVDHLEPDDLVNKWGFGDGDIAQSWLREWLPGSWAEKFLSTGEQGPSRVPIWGYLNDRELLGQAVRELLLPELSLPQSVMLDDHDLTAQVRLCRVGSSHNPWRLLPRDFHDSAGMAVGLEDVAEEAWEMAEWHISQLLVDKASVPVRAGWVRAAANASFEPRTPGWLLLYDAVGWRLDYQTIRQDMARTAPGEMADTLEDLDDWHLAQRVTTELASGVPEVALGLAAEMITNTSPREFLGLEEARKLITGATLAACEDPSQRARSRRLSGRTGTTSSEMQLGR